MPGDADDPTVALDGSINRPSASPSSAVQRIVPVHSSADRPTPSAIATAPNQQLHSRTGTPNAVAQKAAGRSEDGAAGG